jgi:hypothetical protein
MYLPPQFNAKHEAHALALRPESHVAIHAANTQGSFDEQALADWMVKLGLA